MRRVKYGDCYNFDKVPPLDAVETGWVIEYMLERAALVPIGEKYVVDLSFGPDNVPSSDWPKWVKTRRAFNRAEFVVSEHPVKREAVVNFYREHFGSLITLEDEDPAPVAEEPNSNVVQFRRKEKK
jgi:hypothetical protein